MTILRVNIIALIFYGLGYGLSEMGLPFLLYLAGLLIFFLPGINLGWALEALTGRRLGLGKLCVWSLAVSPLFNSVVSQVFLVGGNYSLNEKVILGSVLVAVIVTMLTAICIQLVTKQQISDYEIQTTKAFAREVVTVIGVVVLFQCIHFLLYSYIPEVDGYTYLIKLESYIQTQHIEPGLWRTLFYNMILELYYLTSIPVYWIFKAVLPLITSMIIVPFYLQSREVIQNQVVRQIAALIPFTFPVISMEILYARPQAIFILVFTCQLYLMAFLLGNNNPKKAYWVVALLAMSMVGLKIHEFFIFLVILNFIALGIALLPYMRRYPIESVIIAGLMVIGMHPWAVDLGLLEHIGRYGAMFRTALLDPVFNMWFVDSYINTDGNQMGWPGAMALFYYGYNLGIALPTITLFWLVIRRLSGKKLVVSRFYLVGFSIFFLIAEIFPRLGLAFLPDRAWLFASICSAFLALGVLGNLSLIIQAQKFTYLSFVILGLSFITNWSVTYAKRGVVSRDERIAARFIENTIPKDAVILSQGSNVAFLGYFADRKYFIPPAEFFLSNSVMSADKAREMVLGKSTNTNVPSKAGEIKELIMASVDEYLRTMDSQARKESLSELQQHFKEYEDLTSKEQALLEQKELMKMPIYIVFSEDKFDGLYGKRDWWRTINYYGTKIEKFNDSVLVERVYNSGGIHVWRYK